MKIEEKTTIQSNGQNGGIILTASEIGRFRKQKTPKQFVTGGKKSRRGFRISDFEGPNKQKDRPGRARKKGI